MVKIDIVPVDDGCYAPHDRAILYRHVGDNLGMLQKGVLEGEVKGMFLEQGRNPVGISAVYLPGETEKGLQIIFGLDLLDGDALG